MARPAESAWCQVCCWSSGGPADFDALIRTRVRYRWRVGCAHDNTRTGSIDAIGNGQSNDIVSKCIRNERRCDRATILQRRPASRRTRRECPCVAQRAYATWIARPTAIQRHGCTDGNCLVWTCVRLWCTSPALKCPGNIRERKRNGWVNYDCERISTSSLTICRHRREIQRARPRRYSNSERITTPSGGFYGIQGRTGILQICSISDGVCGPRRRYLTHNLVIHNRKLPRKGRGSQNRKSEKRRRTHVSHVASQIVRSTVLALKYWDLVLSSNTLNGLAKRINEKSKASPAKAWRCFGTPPIVPASAVPELIYSRTVLGRDVYWPIFRSGAYGRVLRSNPTQEAPNQSIPLRCHSSETLPQDLRMSKPLALV